MIQKPNQSLYNGKCSVLCFVMFDVHPGGGLKLTMWRNSPQPRASSRRSLVPVGTVNPQSPFGPSPSFFLSCCVYDEAIMPVFLKSRTFARIEKCTKSKTCSVVNKNFRIVVVSVHVHYYIRNCWRSNNL